MFLHDLDGIYCLRQNHVSNLSGFNIKQWNTVFILVKKKLTGIDSI